MGLTIVQVRGSYDAPWRTVSGTRVPAQGQVEFRLSTMLRDAETNANVAPTTQIASLDENGTFYVFLVATDSPGVEPSDGVTYHVVERLMNGDGQVSIVERDIEVLSAWAGGGVDIADIAPAVGTPVFTYVLEEEFLTHVHGTAADNVHPGYLTNLPAGDNIWLADEIFASGRPWVDIRSQGAVGDTTDETAKILAALDLLPAGGIFLVSPPAAGGFYYVTDEIGSDRDDICVLFAMGAKIKSSRDTVDLLSFSGDNVGVVNPRLEGPGTFVIDFSTVASLVHFTGDNCEVNGGLLINPPSAGIQFDHSIGGRYRTKIEGGAPSSFVPGVLNHTNQFGIYNNASTKIRGLPGAHIRQCIEGLFAGTAGATTVDPDGETSGLPRECLDEGVIFDSNLDHAVYYDNGERNTVSNAVIKHQASTAGAAITMRGLYPKVRGGHIVCLKEAVDMRNPVHASVIDLEAEQTATGASDIITYRRETDGDIIGASTSHCTLTALGSASRVGIRHIATNGKVADCSADHNKVYGGGVVTDGVTFETPAGFTGYGNSDDHNKLYDVSGRGVYLLRAQDSNVGDHDRIIRPGTRGIELDAVTHSSVDRPRIIDDRGTPLIATGIYENNASGTSDFNEFTVDHQIIGPSAGNAVKLTGVHSSAHILRPAATVSTMTASESIYVESGHLFLKDPGGANRSLNPTGVFPAAFAVEVRHTGSANSIAFNSTGINVLINAGQTGRFVYNGTAWVKLSLA